MSETSGKGPIAVAIQRGYDLDAETAAALNLQLLFIHMTTAEQMIRKYQEFSDGDPLQRHPEAYPVMVNALEVGMVAAARAALAVLRDPRATSLLEDEAIRLVLHIDRLVCGSAPIECVRYFTEVPETDRNEIDRWGRRLVISTPEVG